MPRLHVDRHAQHPHHNASQPDQARIVQLEMLEAATDLDFTRHFFRRQHACYSRFRSEAAAAPHQTRESWKGVYLVAATDSTTGELCGGVGVYERHPDAPLPVEQAIGNTPKFRHALAAWHNERVVELSGLWVEESWRRTGLSTMLMLMAMSTAKSLRATRAVGFSHQHVLEFYKTIGLIPDPTLGQYNYPDLKYISTPIWGDPIHLTTVPPESRKVVERFAKHLRGHRSIVWEGTPRIPATHTTTTLNAR